MVPVEIPKKHITLYLPQSFAECDRQQARDVSRVLYSYTKGDIPIEELQPAIVIALLNLKIITHNDPAILNNLALLSEFTDSFFEKDEQGRLQIVTDHQDNPFTWLRPKWCRFYGPQDSFENISFSQYVDALNAFCDYADTQDDHYLCLLIAILFSRKNTLSRKLKPYDRNSIKKQAEKFKHLDKGYLFGTYLYFASFQKYLMNAKVYWEGRELDLSILFKSMPGEKTQPQSEIPGLGMMAVKFSMAESGVFGNIEQLDNTPFWQVITRMYDIRKRDLDYQNQTKEKS